METQATEQDEEQRIALTPQDISAMRAIVCSWGTEPEQASHALIVRAAHVWLFEGGHA